MKQSSHGYCIKPVEQSDQPYLSNKTKMKRPVPEELYVVQLPEINNYNKESYPNLDLN